MLLLAAAGNAAIYTPSQEADSKTATHTDLAAGNSTQM
jgi:hypothetical protein